jgi:hypothetical protein
MTVALLGAVNARNLSVLVTTVISVGLAAKCVNSKREIPPPEAFHVEPMQASAPRRAPVTRPIPLAAALVDVAPVAVSLPAPPLPPPASPVTTVGEPDAGPSQSQAEVTALKQEVQSLKSRGAQLEQQVQQLQARPPPDEAPVVQELQSLRQQVANDTQARQTAKLQAAQQKQATEAAISALVAADARLATGDTEIDAAIAQGDQAFGSHARWNLAAMRHAIENKDLANARLYLQQAIADAQLSR